MAQRAMTKTTDEIAGQIPDEDALRADLYDFLAALLSHPPDKALMARAAGLSGDDTDLGRAIGALARLASALNPTKVGREFNALFIGVTRGELLPYASFYLTGFLNERPLAQLREDMIALGLERAPNVFEPEDNIAALMEMMAAIIRGRFAPPADLDRQRDFFNRHIAPWAGHFFTDLEAAENSVFYAPIGTIGRLFVEIEKQAFKLAGQPPA